MVEVLVATVLLAIGMTASLSGYASLSQGLSRAKVSDRLLDLAERKLDEITATGDVNALDGSGDFSEEGASDVRWTSQSADAGVTDLTAVTVTVTGPNDATQKSSTLMYRSTATTTGGAATGAPAGAPVP